MKSQILITDLGPQPSAAEPNALLISPRPYDIKLPHRLLDAHLRFEDGEWQLDVFDSRHKKPVPLCHTITITPKDRNRDRSSPDWTEVLTTLTELPTDFDRFIKDNWPAGIPRECTRLKADQDCLQRDRPYRLWCKSCKTYDQLNAPAT